MKDKFYVITELATSIVMVESDDLKEIKEIFKKYYNKKYYMLEDNYGKEVNYE